MAPAVPPTLAPALRLSATNPTSLRAELSLALAVDAVRRVRARQQPKRIEKLGHDHLPALMARASFSEANRILAESRKECVR